MEKQEGICYECLTKNGDSSKKPVYYCDLCQKWYCQLHSKPKFPYFVDWETQFDVQGNPAVKAMFHSEYGRKDGHSDFEYLRQYIEREKEKKSVDDELIERNLNRMNYAVHRRREKKKTIKAVGIMTAFFLILIIILIMLKYIQGTHL